MGLTFIAVFSWFSVMILCVLPRKLPLIINSVLYLLIEFILINKLSLITYKYKLLAMSPDISKFIGVILHRDIIFPFLLLFAANVLFTSVNMRNVILAIICSVVYISFTSYMLHRFSMLIYLDWQFAYDVVIVVIMHLIVFIFAFVLQRQINKRAASA
ncbi:hypothetical protein [Bacillus sp. T33-2]|uniref:hypothetical protein n=1 Tax=Bacillus sp. T33-2 TaxID=2054168 RepID=UPI000C771532|nr:hypothetical protein [Bacillus sp. T33-2]PLR98734.1 hypothetical protein CVD19_03590 [Bacillus sp. T33-2]